MIGMRALLIVGLASGCTYTAGSFAHGVRVFTGEKATIGCLDLAVERRDDHDKSAVLAYKFGNRCDRPTTVDLANAVVIGRDAEGGEHRLRPFDPRGEIRPLPVDARLVGGEAIAYTAEDDVGAELVQVCVDAATIAGGQREHWMCFAKKPEPVDRPEDALPPSEQAEVPPGELALAHEEER